MISVPSKMFGTESKDEESSAKRRKKSTNDDEPPKQIVLPQKKRVLPPSATMPSRAASPIKKKQLSQAATADEQVDDETLIRETEAALKSLSGSWPGPRGSAYPRGIPDHNESPTFENLFEEKKANPKLSPTPSASSSGDSTSCSLKDVITLRDPHSEEKPTASTSNPKFSSSSTSQSTKQGIKNVTGKNEIENLMKIETECVTIQSGIKGRPKDKNSGKLEGTTQYEPPDFNELVDDSSNELEIDMSDPCVDRDTDGDDKMDDTVKSRKKDASDKRGTNRCRYGEIQSSQPGYVQGPYAAPFSSASSAFRPPNVDSNKTPVQRPGGISMPLGPYPAEATFVGYPDPLSQPTTAANSSNLVDNVEKLPRTVQIQQLKSIPTTVAPSVKEITGSEARSDVSAVGKTSSASSVSVASPDTKQYTILQPAAGSRAASALQDIASREGVQVVSAVSSSGTNTATPSQPSPSQQPPQNSAGNSVATANPPYERPTGTLSPTSMSRGKFPRKLFHIFSI